MGRMKEVDWVKMEQNEQKDKHYRRVGILYNDLINMQKIGDDNVILFCLVQVLGNNIIEHIFDASDIKEINGVSLTYQKVIKKWNYNKGENEIKRYRYITVPFDKVIYSYYETRSAEETIK